MEELIKSEEVLKVIPRLKIMNALAKDDKFSYASVGIIVKEIVKNEKFNFEIHYNKEKPELIQNEEMIPENEDEARLFRKMKKYPQNIYAALVTMKEDDNFNSSIIYEYEAGPGEKAVIRLTDQIIQEFIKFNNFTKIEEIQKYISEYERKTESENLAKQLIADMFRKRVF